MSNGHDGPERDGTRSIRSAGGECKRVACFPEARPQTRQWTLFRMGRWVGCKDSQRCGGGPGITRKMQAAPKNSLEFRLPADRRPPRGERALSDGARERALPTDRIRTPRRKRKPMRASEPAIESHVHLFHCHRRFAFPAGRHRMKRTLSGAARVGQCSPRGPGRTGTGPRRPRPARYATGPRPPAQPPLY